MTMKHSILFSAVMLAGFAQAQQETTQNANQLETLNRPATATLQPTKGNQAKGTVTFTPTDDANKVKVQVHLSDLKPGSRHGMHVHEKGDCSAPDASSAGGHFNPAGKPHGDRSVTEKHAGDLGHQVVLSLGRWSSQVPTGLLVPHGTQVSGHEVEPVSHTGVSPSTPHLPRCFRYQFDFLLRAGYAVPAA